MSTVPKRQEPPKPRTALTKAERINSLKDMLDKRAVILQQVASRYLDPRQLIQMALVAASHNPDILECTKESILLCLIRAARWGVTINGETSWIIPYKKEATLTVGYRDMMRIARRSKEIKKIVARVVREGDVFEYEYGLNEKLVHIPSKEVFDPREDCKQITHVYCIAWLTNGESQFIVLNKKEIDALRARSKASASGPWVTDYGPMAMAKGIRQLCKFTPAPEEMQDLISKEEQEEAGLPASEQFFVEGELVGSEMTQGQAIMSKIKGGKEPESTNGTTPTEDPADLSHQDADAQ